MSSSSTDTSEKPSILSHSLSFLKFFGSCISLWGIGYMRFSATWIALGAFGYFLVHLAQNKRVQLTSSLKAIGENEKKFILKNFSVRDLPSWVYFPDVERAEWFNKVVKRLWPFVSDYAKDIILQTVAPAVSAQLPSALKPFEFLTIDLGDTPPRIGGVKVYMDETIKRDEVVMDLDVMLYSDARIKVQLGKIRAGVKEFELRGTLRVLLKPLISKVPFAGAVTVCFLDSPYINFVLTDMGNLLGLPGIQQTLSTVIRKVVDDMVVLPNRLPIQLVDNVDVRRLRYPLPQGLIRVNVIAARNLKVGDKAVIGTGSSDPYCIIRVGARTFETQVKQKTLNPEWNAYFETLVDVRRGQFLEIEVYDKDQGNKDDTLGTASVALESVHELGELDTWVKLEGVKTGSVHLKLTWFNLSDRADDVVTASEQALLYRNQSGSAMSSGFLYVVVEEGKNLMRLKQMREPSPYCNLLLGRDAQNTEIRNHTQSPHWESVHQFLVGDPHIDILNILVRDSRTETLLGRCKIPVRMLLSEKQMSVAQPFQLEEAGPDGAILFLHLEFKALVQGEKQDISSFDGSSNVDTSVTSPCDVPAQDVVAVAGPTHTDTTLDSDLELRHRVSVTNPSVEENTNSSDRISQQANWLGEEMMKALRDESGNKHENHSDSNVIVDSRIPDISGQLQQATEHPLGLVHLTIEYSSITSVLSVTIHSASNLRGVDKDGLADPYVKLLLLDQRGTVKSEHKTNPLKDTLNPIYEQRFSFNIGMDQLPVYGLRVDVKNHVGRFTTSGRTHQMGSAYIDLRKLVSDGFITDWFPLAPLTSLSYGDTHSLSSY